MSDQKIQPNEVYVTEHGAIIRTRCPREAVTDQMIHQRVVAANLTCGDVVRVQCLNHERDTVLHFAEWLVYNRKSEVRRTEMSDRETRTSEVFSHSILRIVDWTATPAAQDPQTVIGKAVWNVGAKAFDIVVEGVVVGQHPDKETAQKIAAGELPLPGPESEAA